ncbi:MAG: hypothetical protein KGH61_05120 [Candidatus Micrarchaeota archaeon]|nr:hypothetical protein [Candidatus Micrarchaeota archaeon]MDE1848296.1 hypothetical protein [Candidatus Micrarchaeota archaeon]MDE1864749.1 hypothetical protein [Candidatus Micrarchaeota archaeon]
MKFERSLRKAEKALKLTGSDLEKVDLVGAAISLYRPSQTKLLMEHYKLGGIQTAAVLLVATEGLNSSLKDEKEIMNRLMNGEIDVKNPDYMEVIGKRELSVRTMQNVIDRLNEIGWVGLEARR